MDVPQDEHERTLAFAEIALGQIKALGQSASPRNFEIWYHYATGYNQPLNQPINETLAKNGTLSETDLEQIYDTYLSDSRFGERIDTVGTRVLDEIKQVMSTIDAAAGSATSYSKSLNLASEKLAQANDGEALRAVIEHLVQGAKDMETSNKKLEARLAASRQEIEQLQHNLEAVRTESLTDPLTTLANRKYLRCRARQGHRRSHGEKRAAVAADGRHRPLQELQRQVRPPHRRPGAAPGGAVGEAERQGPGYRRALWRRGIRHRAAEHAAAIGDHVADHIRRAVMTKELMKRSSGERLGRVTISIGVAMLRPTDTAQLLIERADKCLYAAKRNGRNRVICETDPEADGAETATRVRRGVATLLVLLVPAKAGTQRENLGSLQAIWIPAFAGMSGMTG